MATYYKIGLLNMPLDNCLLFNIMLDILCIAVCITQER